MEVLESLVKGVGGWALILGFVGLVSGDQNLAQGCAALAIIIGVAGIVWKLLEKLVESD